MKSHCYILFVNWPWSSCRAGTCWDIWFRRLLLSHAELVTPTRCWIWICFCCVQVILWHNFEQGMGMTILCSCLFWLSLARISAIKSLEEVYGFAAGLPTSHQDSCPFTDVYIFFQTGTIIVLDSKLSLSSTLQPSFESTAFEGKFDVTD